MLQHHLRVEDDVQGRLPILLVPPLEGGEDARRNRLGVAEGRYELRVALGQQRPPALVSGEINVLSTVSDAVRPLLQPPRRPPQDGPRRNVGRPLLAESDIEGDRATADVGGGEENDHDTHLDADHGWLLFHLRLL